MQKKILLNAQTNEKRAAIFENNKLVEIFVEACDGVSLVGNIYIGRVVKVVPGMQAAFINIGLEKNGFLQINQLAAYKLLDVSQKEKISISSLIHEGENIIVQISKDAFGDKGPRLTTLIELPGQFVVYLPNDFHVAVSKKMDESDREYWRRFGQSICKGNEGIIFRTACKEHKIELVQTEVEYLQRKWINIENESISKKTPSLLFDNSSLEERLVRDVISDQSTEIIVDSGEVYQQLKERLSIYEQGSTSINYYMKKENIFSYFDVEQEIERVLRPYVWLKNGASLMIEQTEALTVIDVNTGKFTGKYNARETIVKTNEIAAIEIARQLRLRNIGGMILIDFINMEQEKDRNHIKHKLTEALKQDRSYSQILGFTKLGLLEMTRKKERRSLLEILTMACPTCNELGRVYSSEQVAFRIERTLWEYKGMDHDAIWLEAPAHVVGRFTEKDHLKRLEEVLGFKIFLTSSEGLMDSFHIKQFGSEAEIKSRIL